MSILPGPTPIRVDGRAPSIRRVSSLGIALGLTVLASAEPLTVAPDDSPLLHRLFGSNPAVTIIAKDLGFAEGVVWDTDRARLIFSDIPNHKVYFWRPAEEPKLLPPDTHQGNGNAIAPDGSLYTAEHHGRRIRRRTDEGHISTVVSAHGGRRLNSPNDLVFKSDGTLWFTDPDYGILNPPKEGPRPAKEQPANHVFRLDPATGDLQVVASDLDMPNGLCFSPDEAHLYVSDSGSPRNIRVYPVRPDNTLGPGRIFTVVAAGHPDGIKTDPAGRLWAGCGDGVQVFSPTGDPLGTLRVSAQVSNLCFGGPAGRTLYLTTPHSVVAVQAREGLTL